MSALERAARQVVDAWLGEMTGGIDTKELYEAIEQLKKTLDGTNNKLGSNDLQTLREEMRCLPPVPRV